MLTFGESGGVVVDVAEGDVDGGGPCQPPQLAPHVLGLNQDLVNFFYLPVHVWQSCPDNPFT